MFAPIPEELEYVTSREFRTIRVTRPINEFGQTVEGGHNWELKIQTKLEFFTYETDSYPYCYYLACSCCDAWACDAGCNGWDIFLEKCEESDNANRQGKIF